VTIALDVHLEDDRVASQAVDSRDHHGLVAERVEMPQRLPGESLKSGSSIRVIPCMASAFRRGRSSPWTDHGAAGEHFHLSTCLIISVSTDVAGSGGRRRQRQLDPAVLRAACGGVVGRDRIGVTEAARRQLQETDDTVVTIAARCGFGAAETMRRNFIRRVGISPDQYRKAFA